MPKVLLIDDDRDLVDLLRYAFQRDGHSVVMTYDGEAGLRAIRAELPDLVVLDLMMPKKSGMDVLRELQGQATAPIIVLTALGDEDNLVSALQLGADDYLTKPFRPRELRARSQALLRRSHKAGEPRLATQPIIIGDIRMDPAAHEVSIAGEPAQLTRIEFALLRYLMVNRDTVLKTSDIIENVWGYDADENDEVVKVTISRLRRKIEADSSNPRYIINVPGVGYKFLYKALE